MAYPLTPFGPTPLAGVEAVRTARIFRALGDPSRLQILGILHNGNDLNGVDIGRQMTPQLSQPTVSHHLTLLRIAGMISEEKDGRYKRYRLLPEGVDRAASLLLVPPVQS